MKANIDFVLPRLATGGDLHHDDDGGQMSHDWYEFGTVWIKDNEQTGPAHRIRGSATIGIVQVETLEQIAERLGWTPERLAEARAREASPSPPHISDGDHARAKTLSESLDRTRRALDEAS